MVLVLEDRVVVREGTAGGIDRHVKVYQLRGQAHHKVDVESVDRVVQVAINQRCILQLDDTFLVAGQIGIKISRRVEQGD